MPTGSTHQVSALKRDRVALVIMKSPLFPGGLTLDSEASESLTHGCTNCGVQSRPVSRKTVLLMLKPELLEQAMTGTYRFCSARDCPVVYFEERESHRFTIDDLRMRIGLKVKEDPIPLCYCFGFEMIVSGVVKTLERGIF